MGSLSDLSGLYRDCTEKLWGVLIRDSAGIALRNSQIIGTPNSYSDSNLEHFWALHGQFYVGCKYPNMVLSD